MKNLTHFDADGQAHMVNVGDKHPMWIADRTLLRKSEKSITLH